MWEDHQEIFMPKWDFSSGIKPQTKLFLPKKPVSVLLFFNRRNCLTVLVLVTFFQVYWLMTFGRVTESFFFFFFFFVHIKRILKLVVCGEEFIQIIKSSCLYFLINLSFSERNWNVASHGNYEDNSPLGNSELLNAGPDIIWRLNIEVDLRITFP